VFAGGFDLGGAEAVLAGGSIDALEVMDLVASLMDKSLVTRLSAEDREPRYRLLDSTRQYALETLAQAGEMVALQRAHAQHMVTLFGAARHRHPDTDTIVWRGSIEPDIENLQAALRWAFSDEGDDGIAIALAARLLPVMQQALVAVPILVAFARAAVTKLAPETPCEDVAWLWMALARDTSAGARACAAAAETAQALFEALQDMQMAARAAATAAFFLIRAGDATRAKRSADAAREILPAIPPNLNCAYVLNNLANYHYLAKQDGSAVAVAQRDYASALEIYEKFNSQSGVSIVSGNTAEILASLGDYEGAIDRAKRIVSVGSARRDWRNVTKALQNLTSYSLLAGDDTTAAQVAREAAPLAAEMGDQRLGASFTGCLALLAARAGRLNIAAKLAGHASHFYVSNQEMMDTTVSAFVTR
jgi:tetratricopeptide (TPR) repeat protein